MKGKVLSGEDLKRILSGAAAKLEENKEAVNALNVFPVPDGDTGTNMSYTIISASKEAEKIKGNSSSASDVAEAAAFGALMGARGNSGVILSQLLRGFAAGVSGKEVLEAEDIAKALNSAVNTAYKAVMRPVEGTILTVARDAAKAAAEKAEVKDVEIMDVLMTAIEAGEESLRRTPEKLPVLREAGVVDAGGKGLMVIAIGGIEALSNGTSIKPIFEEAEDKPAEVQMVSAKKLVYKYCTEYIIKPSKNHINLDDIKADLSQYGDSLLIAGSSDLIKVHIHTNNPGTILEYGLRFGDLDAIQIDNMAEQTKGFSNPGNAEEKDLAIIAVASGSGMVEIFKSLGADIVIEGGQTMNPSAESFMRAIEGLNAKEVLLLPNNKNIVLTARQVKDLTSTKIEVIPSKSVVEGIRVLMALDHNLSLQENMDAMMEAIKDVKFAEVTYAVRDWERKDIKVKKGDFIGLYNGKVQFFGDDRDEVLLSLVKGMLSEQDEIVTIYVGEDVSEEEVKIVQEKLQAEIDGVDIEFYRGEQPLYFYLVGVEYD